jgi:glycerophosphoryl diester phosphodiesterase
MVASSYARNAKAAGLNIIAWSLERSGVMALEKGGWYYQTVNSVIENEGDMLVALDVLAKDVGVIGVFSDWPGTTTYYANCMK